jgi:hypothetical protein
VEPDAARGTHVMPPFFGNPIMTVVAGRALPRAARRRDERDEVLRVHRRDGGRRQRGADRVQEHAAQAGSRSGRRGYKIGRSSQQRPSTPQASAAPAGAAGGRRSSEGVFSVLYGPILPSQATYLISVPELGDSLSAVNFLSLCSGRTILLLIFPEPSRG